MSLLRPMPRPPSGFFSLRLLLRGIPTEDAVNMIVSCFCKDVFRELPMEFAVEAPKLLGVSLEGSVD